MGHHHKCWDRPTLFTTQPHHRFVHLSIDVQKSFIKDLGQKHSQTFPHLIENLSSALRLFDVPTIHIGTGLNPQANLNYYPAHHRWKAQNNLPARHDFPHDIDFAYPIHADEDIIRKHTDSCLEKKPPRGMMSFYTASMRHILQKQKTQTLILSGLHTSCCILSNCKDALESGYNVWVIIDHLSDNTAPTEQNENPAWHHERLAQPLEKFLSPSHSNTGSLCLLTAKKCFDLLTQRQRPAHIAQALKTRACTKQNYPPTINCN